MDWKAMAKKASKKFGSGLSKFYNKLELAFNKAYRGLLCEKKDGQWEMSKGNVAFWIVLSHCMLTWGSKAGDVVKKVAGVATEAAGDILPTAVDTVTTMAPETSMLDTLMGMGTGGPVTQQEFWFLCFLLGYATVKHTKGSMTNALSALRGNK